MAQFLRVVLCSVAAMLRLLEGEPGGRQPSRLLHLGHQGSVCRAPATAMVFPMVVKESLSFGLLL